MNPRKIRIDMGISHIVLSSYYKDKKDAVEIWFWQTRTIDLRFKFQSFTLRDPCHLGLGEAILRSSLRQTGLLNSKNTLDIKYSVNTPDMFDVSLLDWCVRSIQHPCNAETRLTYIDLYVRRVSALHVELPHGCYWNRTKIESTSNYFESRFGVLISIKMKYNVMCSNCLKAFLSYIALDCFSLPGLERNLSIMSQWMRSAYLLTSEQTIFAWTQAFTMWRIRKSSRVYSMIWTNSSCNLSSNIYFWVNNKTFFFSGIHKLDVSEV